MGWCHEFGVQITAGCSHPMKAGATSCSCATCATTCPGRFPGCSAVWERGPREVVLVTPDLSDRPDRAERVDRVAAVEVGSARTPPFGRGGAAEGNGRGGEWLETTLEAIWSQLQALTLGLAHQQSSLEAHSDNLVASLGGFIDTAVEAAMQVRLERFRSDFDGCMNELRAAIGDLRLELAHSEDDRARIAGQLVHVAQQLERVDRAVHNGTRPSPLATGFSGLIQRRRTT